MNGTAWRNYDILAGPLGERVFDIAVCPTDGDVWIATNAGLTRYSVKSDNWSSFTRADGLPADGVQAIAFDRAGNIIVGTQADGVALASAANGYKNWRVVNGPDTMPLTPTGAGLPSSLINDVLVARDGTIYAATTTGLAWSRDGGANWRFVRGQDYAAKVAGLINGAPTGWKETPGAILAEDYVSTLAQDAAGRLWVGHWRAGNEVLEMDGATGEPKTAGAREKSGFVHAILPLQNGATLLARYDEGIAQSLLSAKNSGARANAATGNASAFATRAAFPAAARPASIFEMQQLSLSLAQMAPETEQDTKILPLDDDWRTQGECLDRYGKYWSLFLATNGGGNNHGQGYWGAHVWCVGWIGLNRHPGDFLRFWQVSPQTDDLRSLPFPNIGGRHFAENDDHGEAYSMAHDGPDLYQSLSVGLEPGAYVVSFYFVNDDGSGGSNRWRDYTLDMRATPLTPRHQRTLGAPGAEPYESEVSAMFDNAQGGAHARVRQFWGGVYKRFYVRVKERTFFTTRVARNHSFNTIMSGIFVDSVGEFGMNGYHEKPVRIHTPPDFSGASPTPGSEAAATLQLLDQVLKLRDTNPTYYAVHSRPMLVTLLRRLLTRDANGQCLAEQIEATTPYPNFRPDVAACFNDLGQFQNRDLVYFDVREQQKGETWYWLKRSELYKKYDGDWDLILGNCKWDNAEFKEFFTAKRNQQMWPAIIADAQ